MNQKAIERVLNISPLHRNLFTIFCKVLVKTGKMTLDKGKYNAKELLQDNEIAMRNIITYIHSIYTANRLSNESLYSFIYHGFIHKQIQLFTILCPSYRNDGKPGIKKDIGDTSKGGIKNSIILYQKLKELSQGFFSVSIDLYYGDCGLEEYESQTKTTREDQIRENIKGLNKEILSLGYHKFITQLSEIHELQTKTINTRNPEIQNILFIKPTVNHKIITRNHLFYCNILKRSEEQSKKRSEQSIYNYAIMGSYFTKHYNNPLLLYTANIYEKGAAYNHLNNDKKLMIIYLKKTNGSILPLHHNETTS